MHNSALPAQLPQPCLGTPKSCRGGRGKSPGVLPLLGHSLAPVGLHSIPRFSYKSLQCPAWEASSCSPLTRQNYFLSGSNDLVKAGISVTSTHLNINSHLKRGKGA